MAEDRDFSLTLDNKTVFKVKLLAGAILPETRRLGKRIAISYSPLEQSWLDGRTVVSVDYLKPSSASGSNTRVDANKNKLW